MIDPGEGYRLLEKGEVIQEGDEYAYDFSAWQLTREAGSHHSGDNIHFARRRKLTITVSIDIPAPPKGYKWDGWRPTKEGETGVYLLNTVAHSWVFWDGKISTNIRFHVAIPDPDYDWLEVAELPVRFQFRQSKKQGTLHFKDNWGHFWGCGDDGVCVEVRKEYRGDVEPA